MARSPGLDLVLQEKEAAKAACGEAPKRQKQNVFDLVGGDAPCSGSGTICIGTPVNAPSESSLSVSSISRPCADGVVKQAGEKRTHSAGEAEPRATSGLLASLPASARGRVSRPSHR